MYGQLEEEFGLAKRAMNVYDRATRAVEAVDRLEVRSLSFLFHGTLLM
jgi:pre-mRNA-splicing factor SYF1